jgi:anti-anti-sigma regulatory factor
MFNVHKEMNYGFESKAGFGIVTFSSDLTKKNEKDLVQLLMRAIHGIDRVILNMRNVVNIDAACMKLLKKAYHTSLRLKKPLIVTGLSVNYQRELFNNVVARRMKVPLKSSVYGSMK